MSKAELDVVVVVLSMPCPARWMMIIKVRHIESFMYSPVYQSRIVSARRREQVNKS
jgi:hypothetical protein